MSVAEIMARDEQIQKLENENQRLREIIALKSDNEAYLTRRVDGLKRSLDALRGELRVCGR